MRAILLAAALSCAAFCEVADSSAAGFTLKTTLTIKASPDDVYRRFLHNIGDWWSSDHTFSGDAHNLSIEDRVQGCFCEKLPSGGGLRHMQVVYLQPGKIIGLSGALGPMQTMATTGSMRIQLSAVEGGTRLQMTDAVAGYAPQGMNGIAPFADKVLEEQVTRLKAYVEKPAQ